MSNGIGAEKFTAESAIDAGLVEFIKRGMLTIDGSFSVGSDGQIKYRHDNFSFRDHNDNIRYGKFVNSEELMKFIAQLK